MLRIACLLLMLAAGFRLSATEVPLANGPTGNKPEEHPKDSPATLEAKKKVYGSVKPDDEIGFTRKAPPQKGQWLAEMEEQPQTLEQYRLQPNIRPDEQRRTIVLQPLGALKGEQKKVLEAMKEYAEAFFQLPARIERPMELDLDKPNILLTRPVALGQRREGYNEQYLAEPILQYILQPNLPKDAVAYLGITMEDLTVQELNYVFGLGSFHKRVGVYSLRRYYPEFWNVPRKDGDELIALRRACKVLNHETGHMFGLSHCIFYECSMNGANSLPETDSQPLHFCPLCQRKLQWNIGFDTTRQYEALLAFYTKYEMKEEAAWMVARLERWKKISAEENAFRKTGDEPEK